MRLLNQEQGDELQRVYRDFEAATFQAGNLLRSKGGTSAEFSEADIETRKLWRRIRELVD